MKNTTPRAKGVAIREREQEQISFDEQEARKLQAQFDEEARIANEEAQRIGEANLGLIEEKKHSVEKRAKEQRSKPQTKAQKRKTMSTYPKNMAGWKSNQLKNKSSSKRAGDELRSEFAKKQKVDDDKEIVELQMLVEITPDEEEVVVHAIPLDTKPLVIIYYKIHKEDKTSYYKITRADRSFKLYKVFSQLLKSFDREDLETLWRADGSSKNYKIFSGMLDDFDRQDVIDLYRLVKESLLIVRKIYGENILKSIDEGPFQMGKFREILDEGALHLGPERDRVFVDLTPEEKDRYKANIRATNILLQGLPKDIYTHINHYTDAKDIWDNVKMLLEGSELTKDKRESQLYDEFKHFRQNKGETIYEYYIRFVTVIKLNRGLKASNYDQLYAYLKQHEAHVNENKIMLERYSQHAIDPLALVSNVSPQ
ncbi:hypothetical protein Tco_0682712 [Tanacetum coccineum]|uniref:Integrase, catalytic region, zinc finger, CCHC-type, peptidase aspartic, catalytic n=1 Tax=Tanacetum coccineum TaxID=301880 RepID=A0ABQ4XS04_9ASTR